MMWKIIEVSQDRAFKITAHPSRENVWLVYRDDAGFVQRLGFYETKEQAETVRRAVNSHEGLVMELNRLRVTLESVRANYDKPEKALHGSWHSFDQMIGSEIVRIDKAIAQAEVHS